VIVAPDGMLSLAVERAVAAVTVLSAVAPPLSAACQNTSGEVSLTLPLLPQFPTVPTTGAGVCDPQSCPSVLPIRAKSPAWFA
jgi:hypothetical protein